MGLGGLLSDSKIDHLAKAPLVDDLAVILVIAKSDLVVGTSTAVFGLDPPDALPYRCGHGYRASFDRCLQYFDIC